VKTRFSLIALITLLLSCTSAHQIFDENQEQHVITVNNNVCKKLYGDVVLYTIFVDSKYTNPWTEYDIYSSIDSMQLAIDWIEKQAESKGIDLNIKLDFHQNEKEIIPIEANLTRKTLHATLLSAGSPRYVDQCADKIGREALRIYGPDTSKVTRTKIMAKDRERLLARLRDIHKTDNVALMYFINNYYRDEISVALHTASNSEPEYAVVSFKQPPVIVHEFLHLFGALDLYISPFDRKKSAMRRKAFAMKEFPNEIMAFPYRKLDSLNISPFTEYLIGWERELDEKYVQMLTSRKIKVAKY
jgi:hypothetical protein